MLRRNALRRVLALACLSPLLLTGSPTVAQARPTDRVVQREVSFTVKNVNRSLIPCQADGKTYTVRGHLTGPASELTRPKSVTLLLHGLSYGEFFSNYSAQSGYNFARKQAAGRHTTVTIDRLGYGASDKPVGTGICFGSRADIAHQIVTQLRAGSYTLAGTAPRFSKVVLAGHSVGGIIAQAEAYSFGDIDGLMVLSYSDTDVSPGAVKALKAAIVACAEGGQRADRGRGPAGYVYFGANTPQQFIAAHFFTPNADPRVVETTAAKRSMDPCGDVSSYMAAVRTNLLNVAKIKVPVLVMTGGQDAIYPVPASKQAGLLTGSRDVTAVTVAGTGHALTLHGSRDKVSNAISTWLNVHGVG